MTPSLPVAWIQVTDARSGPRAHTTLPDDPTRVDTPSVAGLAGATLCDRYRLERLSLRAQGDAD